MSSKYIQMSNICLIFYKFMRIIHQARSSVGIGQPKLISFLLLFQISKIKFQFDRGRHKQILSNLISTPQESFLLLFQILKIKFQFDRGWYKQVLSKCLSAPLESFLIFTSARPVDDEADAKIGKNKEYRAGATRSRPRRLCF
jgi:hypothetical protein